MTAKETSDRPGTGRSERGGDWLLYGAYGYTGRLLAAEAIRRGHRPILAGRDVEKLHALRDSLREEPGFSSEAGSVPSGALPLRVFPLDDSQALRDGLVGVSAVLNAAGPFVETGAPMMEGCLAAGAHYLDIGGEVPSLERAFALDAEARERGVIFMPAVGMDVIPTDAAAALLAAALPSARSLELAIHSPGRPSAGTLQSIVEGVPGGILVRRGGRLVSASPGRRGFRRTIDFGPETGTGPMAGRLGGRRPVGPYTWGDLATAWRTTGIGDITCYQTAPRHQLRLLPAALPLLQILFRRGRVRRFLRSRIARGSAGPSARERREGRVRVWGRVEDGDGASAEVVLEIPEGYRFTALAGIRALESVLELTGEVAGTLTPAGALGVEWVLGLPEVEVVREPDLR